MVIRKAGKNLENIHGLLIGCLETRDADGARQAILEEVHGPGSAERKTLGEGTLGKATMDIFGRPMGPAFPPQYNLSEAAKERLKGELGTAS